MGILVAILLSFGFAFLYAYVAFWLDRFEREPKRLLLVIFLWGAFVATIGAAVGEVLLSIGVQNLTNSESLAELATATLFAPVIEESLKGIAVLFVFFAFYSEFDSLLDGIIYSTIVALGFAATENALYIAGSFVEQGWVGLFAVFFLRVILSGWNHPFYTAFIGIALAGARLSRNTAVRWLAPMGGWFAAVGLHSLYNALISILGGGGLILGLLVSWVGWLFILGLMSWAIAQERSWARRFLQDEVERGTITLQQYATACSALAPTWARLRALRSGRYRATRRFYQLCGELAHKKRELAEFGDERGNAQAVNQLRGELALLSRSVA